MNASEKAAKIVVEATLPGSEMIYRTSQEIRTHDFDLHFPGGRVAAVEVTSAVDPQYLRTEAAILDERKGSGFIPIKRSKHDWYINPTPDANINQVRELADEYLAAVEAEGIREFCAEVDHHFSKAVSRIWKELKIEAGTILNWKTPGFIAMALPGQGGWLNPHHVRSTVLDEARKQDNLEKLSRSGASERHLFVYVDYSHLAWMSFREMATGPMPPVSTVITHLWACAPYDRTLAVVCGSVEEGVWRRLPSVPYGS